METNEIVAFVTAISALINVLAIGYQSWRKTKPEVKKLDAEGDLEVVESSYKNLEGAALSQNMLKERVDELKRDIDAEKKARKEDAEYFRRRIKEIEREARDYRLWAARLTKQIIEVGRIPVPFISSLTDSDPLLLAINKEQEQLSVAKNTRQAELDKLDKQRKIDGDSSE